MSDSKIRVGTIAAGTDDAPDFRDAVRMQRLNEVINEASALGSRLTLISSGRPNLG